MKRFRYCLKLWDTLNTHHDAPMIWMENEKKNIVFFKIHKLLWLLYNSISCFKAEISLGKRMLLLSGLCVVFFSINTFYFDKVIEYKIDNFYLLMYGSN